MKRSSKAFLWVTLVFLLGALFGAGVVSLWVEPPRLQQGAQNPSKRQQRIVSRMTQALDLDSEQQGRLRQILEGSRDRFSQANRDHRRNLLQIRRETLRQVESVLSPEQRQKLRAFLKSRRPSLD